MSSRHGLYGLATHVLQCVTTKGCKYANTANPLTGIDFDPSTMMNW